jgi:hypothetical protein
MIILLYIILLYMILLYNILYYYMQAYAQSQDPKWQVSGRWGVIQLGGTP